MRFIGSTHGVELLERLLVVLLDGHGLSVEQHIGGQDGGEPFERLGLSQSPSYTRQIKVGIWWIRFWYDKRLGDDRHGAGIVTIPHKALRELVESLEAQKGGEHGTEEEVREQGLSLGESAP